MNKMFEISSQGRNCLIDFIKAGRLYKDAVYNFTFESRFHIYHIKTGDTIRYHALDEKTVLNSEVLIRAKGDELTASEYRAIIYDVLYAIKYTGNKRYVEYGRKSQKAL